MIDITRQLEEDVLSFDVSDEALEIAAGLAKEGELHPRRMHWPDCMPELTGQQ
jgi:hypothetical protein